MVYPQTVTHPSTNRARRRVTTLIETNAIPLSQATATINITEQYNETRTQAPSCVQAILTYLKWDPAWIEREKTTVQGPKFPTRTEDTEPNKFSRHQSMARERGLRISVYPRYYTSLIIQN